MAKNFSEYAPKRPNGRQGPLIAGPAVFVKSLGSTPVHFGAIPAQSAGQLRSTTMSDRVKVTSRTLLSDHWGRLSRIELDYRHADGDVQRLSREVYDHGHAAAVLLFDRERALVTLVRQYRIAADEAGLEPFLCEACAGLLDADDPETCARREALEETGIAVKGLRTAGRVIVSPGSLTEMIYLFIGSYDKQSRTGSGGGLRHEGEDIEVIEMPLAEALEMVADGRIVDAKTVILLQRLQIGLSA